MSAYITIVQSYTDTHDKQKPDGVFMTVWLHKVAVGKTGILLLFFKG